MLKHKNKGFTIIELIVVIAIIAILAAIIISGVTIYIQKAKDVRLNADFQQIEEAARLDYAQCGSWAPEVGPGVPPRFSNPTGYTQNCPSAQSFIPSNIFDASWYCPGCLIDYDNFSVNPDCIGVVIRDPHSDPPNTSFQVRCISSTDPSSCPCPNYFLNNIIS